ncbi:MAG: hypothetical protein ACRELS_11030 [Candidatus Rokuibacteriota bacterium]
MLAALRAKRVSSVELLTQHRRRIERYNPKLNALEDRTPIRFTELVAREWGGFTRPPGYDAD